MITYDVIREAEDVLVEYWKEDGKRVIEECHKITPYGGNFNSFLDHCTACGGNWGGMLLSGIKDLYPAVWEAIPDKMGTFAFLCICSTLHLCGIDTAIDD